jgi:hypothetical protein
MKHRLLRRFSSINNQGRKEDAAYLIPYKLAKSDMEEKEFS